MTWREDLDKEYLAQFEKSLRIGWLIIAVGLIIALVAVVGLALFLHDGSKLMGENDLTIRPSRLAALLLYTFLAAITRHAGFRGWLMNRARNVRLEGQ